MRRRGFAGVTWPAGISVVIAFALITWLGLMIVTANPHANSGPSGLTPASEGFGTVLTSIPVGGGPITPAFDSANGDLYVPNIGTDNVTVISGASNTVIANIPVTEGSTTPSTPVYDSTNGDLYVPCSYLGSNGANASFNVSVISGSTNRVIANISIPGTNYGPLTYDRSNGDLYAETSTEAGLPGPPSYWTNISVISGGTNTVIATIPLGAYSVGLAYDDENGDLYANSGWTGNVSVISGSTNSVIKNVTGPYGVTPPPSPAVDPANGNVYVPVTVTSSGGRPVFGLTVISGATNTLIANISLGYSYPVTPVYDPGNGDFYVSYLGVCNNVTVVSSLSNSVLSKLTLPGGNETYPAVYDGGDGDLYFAMAAWPPIPISTNVSVVSGSTNTVLGTIDVGYGPSQPVYDSSNGELYVPTGWSTPGHVIVIVTAGSTGGTTFLGLTPWEGFALVGGIVVVVVAVAVGAALFRRSTRRKRESAKAPP